MIGLARHCAGT